MNSRINARFFQWWIVGLITCGALLFGLAGFLRIVPSLLDLPSQQDFGAYYVAAAQMNRGQIPYQIDTTFPTDDFSQIYYTPYIYPPFFAALLRPLALLPYEHASILWFFGNIICFIITIIYLSHIFRISKIKTSLLCLICLLLPGVYDTWLLGQVSILLTFMFVVIVDFYTRSPQSKWNDWIIGIMLGLAIAIKIYPIVLGLIFLIHRKIRILFITALTGIASILYGIIFGGGIDNTLIWITKILPLASSKEPFPSNQSIQAVISRLFSDHQFQVPLSTGDNYQIIHVNALINAPILGKIITILLLMGIFLLSLYVLLKSKPNNASFMIDFSIGIVLMLMLSPVVWDGYFVHAFISLFVIGWYSFKHDAYKIALSLSIFLIVVQRYWRFLLTYVQTPLLMMFGLISIVIIWSILLSMRVTGRGLEPELNPAPSA